MCALPGVCNAANQTCSSSSAKKDLATLSSTVSFFAEAVNVHEDLSVTELIEINIAVVAVALIGVVVGGTCSAGFRGAR